MEGKTPMACGDDMKTLLSRHVDGELPPEDRARVEEHVAACGPCRELLQLFQKNESILSNALSTESFGNTVIESVISEIKREAQPIEAKPVDEGATEWFRSRPILQLAAAAVLVVGLVVVLNASHNRDLEKIQAQVRGMSSKVQTMAEMLSRAADESEKTITSIRMDNARRSAPEREIALAFFTPQHLIVKASFDLKQFGAFELYRRNEGQANERFVKISGDRRLDSPEHIDTTVVSGQAYVYKFRAYRTAKDEEFVESFPYTMRVPRVQQLAAERSIRVQCIDIGYTYKVAKFLLHRTINGRIVTEEYAIRPGEKLGDEREVPGVGKVDFRTNLTLDKLEDGNQTLTVNYTRAVLDQNGKPIVIEWKDGTEVVKTEEKEGVLSIRPNMRALFRTAGSTTIDADLWKGSWIQVRSQD